LKILFISPYYATRTPANESAVYWSRDTDRNHMTSILQCHWLKFWWRNTEYGLYVVILSIIFIKNAKIKINNYNRSKPEILWFLWDIVVFRLVLYLLNMICLYLQLLYKIAYEFSYKYDTVLNQFLETETSDRCLICIFNKWDSQVSSYTPFHFPLQSL